MRNWIERIRDYFTRRAYERAKQHWEPMVRITAAQRDIYEHAYLQQRQIINRLKAERERCKCCSLD